MKDLSIFNYGESEVRTVLQDGEPWFVAKDVAKALGYEKTENAIARHCKAQTTTPKQGGGAYNIIPERDVYRLIMRSRLPDAEKFEEWVVGEVIPTIRKTGSYQFQIPQTYAEALRLSADQAEQIEAQQKKIEQDRPKTIFADAVSTSDTSILIGELAKLIRQNGYEIGQNRLFEYLRENGYLIKGGSSRNMPTQYAMERGWFEIKERSIQNPNGSIRLLRTPKVTGKGQMYFVNHFLKEVEAANV